MMKCIDGPAAGQTLTIDRAPVLLRVTLGLDGKFDCLNNLNDMPLPGEKLWVYRLTKIPQRVHIYRRPRGSGWFSIGDYAFLPDDQPAEEVLRDNDKWAAWCIANKQKLAPSWYRDPSGAPLTS